jgi:hypothetical protein
MGFQKKYNNDGSIQTFQIRLVAKGFRQKEGINYFDILALVARITFIRIFLALSSVYNLNVHQINVKNNFPQRRIGLAGLYRTIRGFRSTRKQIYSLQID